MASSPCRVGVDALVAGFGHIPDLLEDLHAEALVVGIVARKVAVVLALGVGASAAKDELFPVAHGDVLGSRVVGG